MTVDATIGRVTAETATAIETATVTVAARAELVRPIAADSNPSPAVATATRLSAKPFAKFRPT